jgi:transposase InsO family protein
MKVAPGLYQYTAVDDCTRYRVLAVFKRRTAANTLQFLEQVVEEMPFPIQRIQTDRGREFFATKVQVWMQSRCVKFRPIKPASPHLNGKVERSQKTDWEEFYETADLSSRDLGDRLAEWQYFYNWYRPHGSLGGKTPMDRYFDLSQKTPFWDDVEGHYDPAGERIRHPNYQTDLRLAKVKRSV